jgi:hypothetical protein
MPLLILPDFGGRRASPAFLRLREPQENFAEFYPLGITDYLAFF